jgi:arylformamidase
MLIDLSITIDDQTPVYPGDPHIQLTEAGTIETDGYALHRLTLGTHSGTHIDAPAHMLVGGATLDALPLDVFVGNATLVDGFSMEAVRAAGLNAGDIVVFNTGMSERFDDPAYFTEYPAMDEAVAAYLVSAGVKLVAIDTCSADNVDGFPIHKVLLGAGIPIVENLTNVASLRGKAFRLIALPLRIDTDGAPARVVAEVIS